MEQDTNTSYPHLEREDCAHCGGTGQILEAVAGQAGMVPCSSCENIPEYNLPNEIPEDPHAQLKEIEEQLQELKSRNSEYKNNRSKLAKAARLIEETSESELLDSADSTVLSHLSSEVRSTCRERQLFDERKIEHRKEVLIQKKQRIETYIEAIENQQESEEDQ